MSELQQREEIIDNIIENNADQSLEVDNQDSVEVEVVDAQQETPPAIKQEEKKLFDPKTDKVEFSTPEQQEKFNYMYKQTKMSDQRNAMLTDLLQKQQERLEELEGRFKQTDSAEAEKILFNKIKAARDSGDDMAEFAATKEMAEFIADKKLSEKVNFSKQSQPQTFNENSPEAKYVSDFMYAKDINGSQLRPWMNNDHPDQEIAINALESIKEKYIGDPYAIPKALDELDQFMRTRMNQKKPSNQQQARMPSPLQGSNLTNTKQKTTIKMTRQELEIAKKLGVDPKRYAARRDEIAGKK